MYRFAEIIDQLQLNGMHLLTAIQNDLLGKLYHSIKFVLYEIMHCLAVLQVKFISILFTEFSDKYDGLLYFSSWISRWLHCKTQ